MQISLIWLVQTSLYSQVISSMQIVDLINTETKTLSCWLGHVLQYFTFSNFFAIEKLLINLEI